MTANLRDLFLSIKHSEAWYRPYAVLRSTLALSTLLTLLFNSNHTLFPEFVSNNEVYYSKLIFWDHNISFLIFEHAGAFKVISILGLLSVISGYYPKITGVFHFLISLLFFKTSLVVDGGDQICANISLMLLPMTLADPNKNHWQPLRTFRNHFSKHLFVYFQCLILLQISVIYFHAGVAKPNVEEWRNGTALWYWATHETFGTNYFLLDIVKFVLQSKVVVYTINWSVIILEILIAMMLFVRKDAPLPRLIFPIAIAFHIGIILLHGIFSFALVMMGCLCFYFKRFEKTPFRLWKKKYTYRWVLSLFSTSF